MEEGTEREVPCDEIGLVVGEPAQFRFFRSAVRKDDRPGTLINSWNEEELTETDPLTATLPASAEAGYGTASEYIVTVLLAEQQRKAKQELEALLLEGLDSGPGVEATDEFWDDERREMGLPPRRAWPS